MTDREKLILEEPEKMCEHCCNFDKEHIGMDGTSLCKLTMTLAYCEDYGGNCMFYNVPKEQIIVPPCKVGDDVWWIDSRDGTVQCEKNGIKGVAYYGNGKFKVIDKDEQIPEEIGTRWCCLTQEEAENLAKRGNYDE